MAPGKIDTRPRLLVVEDIVTTRESYLVNFELEDLYQVDAIDTLARALDALDRCSYSAALVDIMLAGEADIANRDGVKIVERIHRLREGTQVIVLSAQKETQLVRELFKEFDVFDYLDKRMVGEAGFSLISSTVARAVAASRAGETPSWTEAVAALGGQASEAELVARVMSALKFSGGFDNLRHLLVAGLTHLTPLLPPREGPAGLLLYEALPGLKGRFWSKGQGCAVELLLWGRNGDPGGSEGRVLMEIEKGRLQLRATEPPSIERHEFARADDSP